MDLRKKILILSTSDTHGAYEALYKISQILTSMNCDIKMIVQQKTKKDFFIQQYTTQSTKKRLREHVYDYLKKYITFTRPKKQLATKREYFFLSQNESKENINVDTFLKTINFSPDFIFVGMTNGFLNTTDIKNLALNTGAKVINIAVDMAHFTGGCHYAWDCKGYQENCSDCPAIETEELKVIAAENLKIKINNALLGNFEIMNMSEWTKQQALSSKIYKNKNILPNINSIIDTKLLNNNNREFAKKIFGFEEDKFYIMAGSYQSTDPRKGFKHFVEAINILSKKLNTNLHSRIKVIIVSEVIIKDFENLPFSTIYLDFIKDYRLLSLLYQATDVFVCSSIEDAGPMMVSESLACGTPVVAFDMGISNTMVITGKNGYLAELKNSEDLALGIENIYKLSREEYTSYSKACVQQIEMHSSYEYVKTIFKKILN